MLKTLAGALAMAGAVLFAAPSAQAASVDGVSALTQDLSAQTVVKKNGREEQRHDSRADRRAQPHLSRAVATTAITARPITSGRIAVRRTVMLGLGGWW